MLAALTRFVRFVATHSRWLLLAAVLWAALSFGFDWRERRGYKRGHADALTQAALVLPARVDTVRLTTARTDTTIRRVVQRIATTDTLIERVHDTVLVRFPEVTAALQSCSTLAQDCERLRADVLTERVAREQLHVATSLLVVAKTDSIRTLTKRPTRRAAGVVAIALGLLGYAVGTTR